MKQSSVNNFLIYCGLAVAQILALAVAAALAAGAMPGFREGEFFAPAADLLATLMTVITPILATAVAASRARLGSETIARQVEDLREQGVPRSQMVVLSEQEAAERLAAPLTHEQRAVILADLKAELARDPSGRLGTPRVISQPPTVLTEERG